MQTAFETYLIDRGYKKFIFDCATMKFEPTEKHTISTMVNLDHRYFHNSDPILEKIAAGKSVKDDGITWADRSGEIVFGLSERHKPPTLCYPRPKIAVKRKKDEMVYIESEQFDDSMNIVLRDIPFDNIFQAMYDKSIRFEFDLT